MVKVEVTEVCVVVFMCGYFSFIFTRFLFEFMNDFKTVFLWLC